MILTILYTVNNIHFLNLCWFLKIGGRGDSEVSPVTVTRPSSFPRVLSCSPSRHAASSSPCFRYAHAPQFCFAALSSGEWWGPQLELSIDAFDEMWWSHRLRHFCQVTCKGKQQPGFQSEWAMCGHLSQAHLHFLQEVYFRERWILQCRLTLPGCQEPKASGCFTPVDQQARGKHKLIWLLHWR